MIPPAWAAATAFAICTESFGSRPGASLMGLILGVAGRMLVGNCERSQGVSMAEKKIEKCAHPGCNCPAAKGSKYCGAYCEGSAGRPSIACNCNHPECTADETAGAAR